MSFQCLIWSESVAKLSRLGIFSLHFGCSDGKLGVALITWEDEKVVTVSSIQKKKSWLAGIGMFFCLSLASSVKYKYMHLKNLLHNDIMSNNVLLKLRNNVWMPKLAIMRKVTLKSNPETYMLSNTQRDFYNKIYL